jgi:hypothetical protein
MEVSRITSSFTSSLSLLAVFFVICLSWFVGCGLFFVGVFLVNHRNFQRRVAVLGLGSLCMVPLERQPPVLAASFDKVLLMMMNLLEEVESVWTGGYCCYCWWWWWWWWWCLVMCYDAAYEPMYVYLLILFSVSVDV